MNKIKGHINQVEVSGSLSMVTVDISDVHQFKAIVLETPNTALYLQKGHDIRLWFKETEVSIGIDNNPLNSIVNQLNGKIISIEKGELLTKVVVLTAVGELTSIISTYALLKLKLVVNQTVVVMVKLNEIMLSEQ